MNPFDLTETAVLCTYAQHYIRTIQLLMDDVIVVLCSMPPKPLWTRPRINWRILWTPPLKSDGHHQRGKMH